MAVLWVVIADMLGGEIKLVSVLHDVPDTRTDDSRKKTLFFLQGVGEAYLTAVGINRTENPLDTARSIDSIEAPLTRNHRARRQGDPPGESSAPRHRAEGRRRAVLPLREDFPVAWAKPPTRREDLVIDCGHSSLYREIDRAINHNDAYIALADQLREQGDLRTEFIEQPRRYLRRVSVFEAKIIDAIEESKVQFLWQMAEPLRLLARYYQVLIENFSDDMLQAGLERVEQDEAGYLVNMSEWSPAVSAAQAREDELVLNDSHWLVIAFLRVYYNQYQLVPADRPLTKVFRKMLGNDQRNAKLIHGLVQFGTAWQAKRYAGLPKPTC